MKKYPLSLMSMAVAMTPIVTTSAFAAPPAVVEQSQEVLSENIVVQVALPKDGKGGSYINNGQKVKIAPGKTIILPSEATEIHLPKGTLFTVLSMNDDESSISSKGGLAKGGLSKNGLASPNADAPGTRKFITTQPVIIPNISNTTIQPMIDAFGSGGAIKVPTEGGAGKPPIVNPFNVLPVEGSGSIPPGEGVTDGNS